MNNLLGETAALGTALCWAMTSTLFTISGQRIGSVNVNRIRLVMAAMLLVLTHLIAQGQLLPWDAGMERWLWLGTSGIVGYAIGDAMLFEAFILVGTRITMLLQALVPIMSVAFAWILWSETLKPVELLAVFITIGSIGWVVSEKRNGKSGPKDRRNLFIGLALGVGGALGQTTGLILSKKGLQGGFSALSGNLIRVLVATIVIWMVAVIRGQVYQTISSLKDKKALWPLWGASFFGPFVGVWLSLVASKSTRLGIAATLMSITPVLVIPISHKVFGEKITLQAVLGTCLAVAGVAILIWAGHG